MKSAVFFLLSGLFAAVTAAGDLATITVVRPAGGAPFAVTGVVEAVRHGTLGAEVSGRVTDVLVRSGDAVKAGQGLVHIAVGDAADTLNARSAAAAGAEARLVSARADFERAQRLRAREYLSVAAMQRSEAALRSAEADAQAARAEAKAARARADWHVVTAPYAGRVTELLVSAGDLATPGRPLVTLYDPAALRVVAHVPESLAAHLKVARAAEFVVGNAAAVAVASWRVIPAIDPRTHSIEVQADIVAAGTLQPGEFVLLLLPIDTAAAPLQIPLGAVTHRSEVTGVYVVDARGVAHLRQVRLGKVTGDTVEVLAGLEAGETVALNPSAAGRP